ncbi:MAG: Gfo/Idh/MocA family protein [Candidatus Melainabacteria bacterium]
MSVLLIGCGRWGRNWAKTLHALGELGGIVEAGTVLRESLQDLYPDTPVFENMETALDSGPFEAAVVATPVPTHARVASQCLHTGLGVLVEKPMAHSLPEAKALMALAGSRQQVLAVGHIILHHPALQALQEMIREGAFGEILAIRCVRMNLGRVRNEESAWWSLAPHDLSIVSALLNNAPLRILDTQSHALLGRTDVPDWVSVSLASEPGVRVHIESNWLSGMKRHETMVIGTKRIAVFDDALAEGEKLRIRDIFIAREGDFVQGLDSEPLTSVPLDWQGQDLLTREAVAFLNAVRQGAPLPNDADNGLAVVRLLSDVQDRLNATRAALPNPEGVLI